MQRPGACSRRDGGVQPAHAGHGLLGDRRLNRTHAILGTSDLRGHPSVGSRGRVGRARCPRHHPRQRRRTPDRISEFFRRPGTTPDQEHNLRPGQLIVAVEVAVRPESQRSGYLKVRDRESYEFALTSAAVAMNIRGRIIRTARVAVGGVGTVPWRLPAVEGALLGTSPDAELLETPRHVPPTARSHCRGTDSRWNGQARGRTAMATCRDAMTRPFPAALPLTGQPVTRVDGRLKVTGKARYAADHRCRTSYTRRGR